MTAYSNVWRRKEIDPLPVPEEDVLSLDQLSSYNEFLSEFECLPPLWAIRNLVKNTGKHGGKYPKYATQGTFSRTSSHLELTRRPFGPLPVSHYDAISGVENRYRKGSPRKQARAGNLREDDYRFWQGVADIHRPMSSCRWCERVKVDQGGRDRHHKNGNQCKQRLLALYKFALRTHPKQVYCFSCMRDLGPAKRCHKRWGIPLCNTVECIEKWKFNSTFDLKGLEQYRAWAEEYPLKEGPFAELGEELAIKDLKPE